jgi:hypothetical protein
MAETQNLLHFLKYHVKMDQIDYWKENKGNVREKFLEEKAILSWNSDILIM